MMRKLLIISILFLMAMNLVLGKLYVIENGEPNFEQISVGEKPQRPSYDNLMSERSSERSYVGLQPLSYEFSERDGEIETLWLSTDLSEYPHKSIVNMNYDSTEVPFYDQPGLYVWTDAHFNADPSYYVWVDTIRINDTQDYEEELTGTPRINYDNPPPISNTVQAGGTTFLAHEYAGHLCNEVDTSVCDDIITSSILAAGSVVAPTMYISDWLAVQSRLYVGDFANFTDTGLRLAVPIRANSLVANLVETNIVQSSGDTVIIQDSAEIMGDLSATDAVLDITSDAKIGTAGSPADLNVSGASSLFQVEKIANDGNPINVIGNVGVTGATNISGKLNVGNGANINGDALITGDAFVTGLVEADKVVGTNIRVSRASGRLHGPVEVDSNCDAGTGPRMYSEGGDLILEFGTC